jgi:hypothetical protein
MKYIKKKVNEFNYCLTITIPGKLNGRAAPAPLV